MRKQVYRGPPEGLYIDFSDFVKKQRGEWVCFPPGSTQYRSNIYTIPPGIALIKDDKYGDSWGDLHPGRERVPVGERITEITITLVGPENKVGKVERIILEESKKNELRLQEDKDRNSRLSGILSTF